MRKMKANRARKFGEALAYVPVMHRGKPHLFTESQMRVARDRAMSQPEDAPRARRWWWPWG